MFASLPHAVNLFCKTSDEYYIVISFLCFNMLQILQFVSLPKAADFFARSVTNIRLLYVAFPYAGAIYKRCNNFSTCLHDNIQSSTSQLCVSVLQYSDNSWKNAAKIFVTLDNF